MAVQKGQQHWLFWIEVLKKRYGFQVNPLKNSDLGDISTNYTSVYVPMETTKWSKVILHNISVLSYRFDIFMEEVCYIIAKLI